MTAEMVCATYHVPAFMIGAGPEPATGSAQERTLRYYTQCLQSLIEDFEACLDEGLGLTDRPDLGVEFDLDNLLRMDTAAQADATVKLVGGSILTPDEGRKRFNKKPLPGGATVYMQQQNYSLEALNERDKGGDPFGTKAKEAAEAAKAEAKPAANDDEITPDAAQAAAKGLKIYLDNLSKYKPIAGAR
jgi:phage portal protein BeeE